MLRLNRWRGEEPRRIYAIGDVHGRLDLFQRLVGIIKRDHAGRLPAPTRMILLGDLVGHGPDSAPLVRWCKLLTERTERFVVLKGDHEAMMVDTLRNDGLTALELWLDHGGGEALASWGVSRSLLDRGARDELLDAARRAVSADILDWMANLPLFERHDDHLFVHAGVRPGVPLDQQDERDLLRIRGEFLRSKEDHGAVVVHGHSIHESGPDMHRNRIGIDSGAFRTGRLTAIGLEDGQTWPLMTEPTKADRAREKARAAVDDIMPNLKPL